MTQAMHQILVIEDDASIREVLRALLGSVGFRVVEAATAQRADIEARAHKPDLLLVDLGLPDGDGISVIREVRSWSTGAHHRAVRAHHGGAEDRRTRCRCRRLRHQNPSARRNCWRGCARHSGAMCAPMTRRRSSPSAPSASICTGARHGPGWPGASDPAGIPGARVHGPAQRHDRHADPAHSRGCGVPVTSAIPRSLRVCIRNLRGKLEPPAAPSSVPGD